MIWCLFALLFSQFAFAQRHDEDLMSFVTVSFIFSFLNG